MQREKECEKKLKRNEREEMRKRDTRGREDGD